MSEARADEARSSEPADPKAIAARYTPWARKVAMSMVLVYGVLHLRDDLVSTALLALLSASESFDPTRGVSFAAYAHRRVAGAVLDGIGKELRHLAFLRAPMLQAPPPSGEAPRDDERIDATVARVDAILASAMDAACLRCMGEDLRGEGEARLLERDAFEKLHGALEDLPPAERRLIELRYFQGLEWRQVAEALHLPERTVKDHDQKIRVRLRKAMRG
ncbi:MAG: sigma-70 family RNA polymerase sigma factor [Byssovorax sp.]